VERWRSKQWAQVPLPVEPGVILLDLEFVPDEPNHGFILGTRQTVLETLDGGKTWEQRFLGSAVRPHARTHWGPKAHSLRNPTDSLHRLISHSPAAPTCAPTGRERR